MTFVLYAVSKRSPGLFIFIACCKAWNCTVDYRGKPQVLFILGFLCRLKQVSCVIFGEDVALSWVFRGRNSFSQRGAL